MSVYTDLYTTPSMSTTGTRQRDVSDTIRHLFPSANMFPLVSSGKISTPDGVVREKGLIGKRSVKSSKFEGFVFTPFGQAFTVSSLSSKTLVLSSTVGLVAKQSLINPADGTTCNIDSVDSATQVTVTSYGDTAFNCVAGDVLVSLGVHMEEKSSTPPILMKDPDNIFNYTHIFRTAVGISRTQLQDSHYGGDRLDHSKKEMGAKALQDINKTLLFDNKPASGESTTSGAGHAFRSLDGLTQWATTEKDFGHSMTYEAFCFEMPLLWDASVSSDSKKILLCGHKFWGIIMGWQNTNNLVVNPGTYDKWGVKSKTIMTCRGDVEVVVVDAYNQGDYAKQGLIMNPEMVDYIFMNERDLQPDNGNGDFGLQNNSVDGKEVGLIGELSIMPNDNGKSLCLLKNAY